MKKTILNLLVLSLIIMAAVGSATAEELTLHSGVAFGMSIQEVQYAERDNGFEAKPYTLEALGLNSLRDPDFDSTVLLVRGIIDEIPNSEIYYFFDKNGRMVNATYSFNTVGRNNPAEVGIQEFGIIQYGLEAKFGDGWGWTTAIDVSGKNVYEQNSRTFGGFLKYNPAFDAWASVQLTTPDGNRISVNHCSACNADTKSERVHLLEYRYDGR